MTKQKDVTKWVAGYDLAKQALENYEKYESDGGASQGRRVSAISHALCVRTIDEEMFSGQRWRSLRRDLGEESDDSIKKHNKSYRKILPANLDEKSSSIDEHQLCFPLWSYR